jgi:hypothetical protein
MHTLLLGRVLIGLRKQVRCFCTISDLRLHLCKSTWRAEARHLENPILAWLPTCDQPCARRFTYQTVGAAIAGNLVLVAKISTFHPHWNPVQSK